MKRRANLEIVDPWSPNCDPKPSTSIYRVDCQIGTVPFTATLSGSSPVHSDRFKKVLRNEFGSILDDKKPNTMSLDPPIETQPLTTIVTEECSSSHLGVILDSLEKRTVCHREIEMIVSAGTLRKISDTIFQSQTSWKLRAYREYSHNNMVIIICDDEIEELDVQNNSLVVKEGVIRKHTEESQKISSDNEQLISRICENEFPDEKINGDQLSSIRESQAVISNFTRGNESMNLIVTGEVDLNIHNNPVNTFVLTGRSRNCKVSFIDDDFVNDAFEYLWSRSFWIGVQTCFFGVRQENDGPIRVLQRLSLLNFYKKYNSQHDKLADRATDCVARVLLKVRRMFRKLPPQANVQISYVGIDDDDRYNMIEIKKCETSISFWLLREHHFLNLKSMEETKEKHRKKSTVVPYSIDHKSMLKKCRILSKTKSIESNKMLDQYGASYDINDNPPILEGSFIHFNNEVEI